MLIQRFQYLEYGQHLGDDCPNRRVRKVSPGTNASTKSIHNVFNIIGFERTIVVEESLGYERV